MMSPQIALHDPTFRVYLVIVPAALALGAAIMALLHFVCGKDLRSILPIYRSWLIMAPTGLLVVFGGRIAVILGVWLLSIFAFREFARASGLLRDWWISAVVYAGITAVALASLVWHPAVREPGPGWFALFMALPVFVIALILLIPIVRNQSRGQLQAMALALIAFLYIGWMFGHLGFLANANNAYGFICYVVFATELNDIAAFTFGKMLGRHPLRSEISPNKTWEGAISALAFSMILPWLMRFSFPFFGAKQLILTGVIVGIGGQLGDLSVSVIKRDIGTKDMGNVIPGHGGILDRIDSLIYVTPLFMHMAGYYYGLRWR